VEANQGVLIEEPSCSEFSTGFRDAHLSRSPATPLEVQPIVENCRAILTRSSLILALPFSCLSCSLPRQ